MPKRGQAPFWAQGCSWILRGRTGSNEAEHGPLIVPGKRQTGVCEELLRRQIARLAPFEDRLGDVGGEIAETDNPVEIGSAHSLAQSKRSKGEALAVDECRVEPMCPDEQLDQATIGFHRGERIAPVDQHSDLHACAAQPCRHTQDHGFPSKRSCNSGIEERAEPCRAQVDVDLIDAHFDPFDQGGEDRTPSCRPQLGPLPPDLRSARDQPLLSSWFWKPCRDCLIDAAGIEKPLTYAAGDKLLDFSRTR